MQHYILLPSQSSGDKNRVYLDEQYAKQTRFCKRVAHGMLTASLMSAAITEQLPGQGNAYSRQTLIFARPVLPYQLIITIVLITHLKYSNRCITLDCKCKVDEKVVLAGEALVLAPSRKFD